MLTDQVRQVLLKASLGYRTLAADPKLEAVTFAPRDPSERDPRPSPRCGRCRRRRRANCRWRRCPTAASRSRCRRRRCGRGAAEAVSQSIEIVVRRRIDATGAIDPEITRQDQDRIVVELPGVSDPDRIKRLLGTTAKMTFHLVASGVSPQGPPPPGGRAAADAGRSEGDPSGGEPGRGGRRRPHQRPCVPGQPDRRLGDRLHAGQRRPRASSPKSPAPTSAARSRSCWTTR